MTLRLILTRHAKSDWSAPGQEDAERPLNAHGRDEAGQIGRWLSSRGYRPDLVLSSPAQRTVETMEHLLAALGAEPATRIEPALYAAGMPALMATLRAVEGQTVLVIGHNPGIADLAAALVHDRPFNPRFADFPTGATAVIDLALPGWDGIAPGLGALRDFVTPDDLS
ncbi:MAG: histidine phosphatase family protein [Rubellimicrobium sp.]|nr:histidine phosphatase family protein [Rubellimicrobium sp.]